ncbi:Caleosin [Cyathus striatus]|nr:Caleosin [Cyathus striatus]
MVTPAYPTYSAPGTGYEQGKRNTSLQQHVAFFDPDGDGIIWPLDTFRGFRDLKFSLFWTIVATLVIHGGFSYVTWGHIFPDPFFRLKIKNMHRAKHGSDSETYTVTGDFDETRFNYNFDLYTAPPHTHMGFYNGVRMIHGNRNAFDPFGWFAAAFEWLATYIFLWPVDGRMKREDVKAIYNGSIFYTVSGRKPKGF